MLQNKWTTVILIGATMLAFVKPVIAYEAGIIKTVSGHVRIERGSSNLEAKVGDSVQENDRVSTQIASSIGISLSDETLLSLGQNSAMVIDRYSFDSVTREGQVETSILKGTLRYVTGLIGQLQPSAIKVTTPTATIGIRGTEFIVEVLDVK